MKLLSIEGLGSDEPGLQCEVGCGDVVFEVMVGMGTSVAIERANVVDGIRALPY